MGIPNRYQTENGFTPSFSYFDFVSGRGYRTFYALITDDSGGFQYILSDRSTSASTYAKRIFYNTNVGVYVSNDFDTTFLTPAIIDGKVTISYTLQASTGGLSTGNAKFEFFHVRGVTATSLGSVVGASNVLAGASQRHRLTTTVTLTRRYFGVGDILRCTVSVQNTANNTHGIWCDPASLSAGAEADTTGNPTIPTTLIMEIPFAID